jgi:hypothetical protein
MTSLQMIDLKNQLLGLQNQKKPYLLFPRIFLLTLRGDDHQHQLTTLSDIILSLH